MRHQDKTKIAIKKLIKNKKFKLVSINQGKLLN